MPNSESVAIFWDYENCSIPGNLTGYEVVNGIRRIAQEFGAVTLFKAYLGFSEQTQSPRSLTLRAELQSSGVSLTDCPHNGRKDVADKMMLVDMLAHAIDHPHPMTYLLISGDRDFSYALSILRLRRYKVILITHPNAHPSLTAQASLRLNWVTNVLNASSSPSPTSPSRKKDPSHRVSFGFTTAATDAQKPTTTAYQSPRSKTKFLFAPLGDGDTTLVPPNDGSPRKRTSRQTPQTPQPTSILMPATPLGPTLGDAPTSFFGTPFRLPTKSIVPLQTPSGGAQQDTTTNAGTVPSTPNEKAQPAISREPKLVVQPPSEHAASQARRKYQQEEEDEHDHARHYHHHGYDHDLDDDTHHNHTPPSHDEEYDFEEYQSDEGMYSSQPASSEEGGARYENYALWDSAGDNDGSPQRRRDSSSTHRRSGSSGGVRSSRSQRASKDTPIPSRFKPLVKQLQLYRSKGIYIPQRTILCIDLGKKHKDLYQNAGVEDFAEYVSQAEQEGIVTLGGGDGLNPWIMLRQEWVNLQL